MPRRCPQSAFRARCHACGLLLLLVASVGQSTEPASESVQDLRYGVTLYHFFQQQYFDALTELTAAQQLEQLPHHAQEAELLRGGMSLSYGMDNEARRVFSALLDTPREGVDADRAWFYVGKLAWRRGDNAASASALANMKTDYAGPLADEAHYLRAMQSLAAGEELVAQAALNRIAQDCPFKPYYFYSLAALRAQAAEWQQAAQSYAKVTQSGCDDDEGAALRDKAFTAAGFSQLAAGEPALAATEFLQVRLHGPEADRALLGYGWSHANQGNYQQALAPWQELNGRSLVSASARESLLAVPFAYEQLKRPATALSLYREAAQQYAREREALGRAIDALLGEDLLPLFGLDAVADPQWLGGEDPEPSGEHAVYLAHLLSTDSVQVALRELYDLRDMQRKLVLAQERLEVLRQVDAQQRKSWKETIEGGRAESLSLKKQQLLQRIIQLRQQLDRAIAGGDPRALAGPEQLARWQRLERAAQRASRLQNAAAQEQLRLMRGLLQWQDNEAFPDQRWRLQQSMEELEALAEQSDSAYAAVQNAVADSARPVFAQRIEQLSSRTSRQRSIVDSALTSARSQLQEVALAELEQQLQHLSFSEGQARLAVARLFDRASPEVPR